MKVVAGLVVVFGLMAVASIGTWIAARILLPDMGLTVPEYHKFMWASVFIAVFAAPLYAVSAFAKELK